MGNELLKNKKFIVGFLFVFLIFSASIFYYLVFDDTIPALEMKFDSAGTVIAAPYSPVVEPPLGTDNLNRKLWVVLLVGAKYTIGIAFGIAILRIILSSLIGIFIGVFLPKVIRFFAMITDAFQYIPVSLFAFLILNWVLKEGRSSRLDKASEYSMETKVVLCFIVLTLVAVPLTSLLFANETNNIFKKEFITGAKIIGGSRLHIFKTHVLPFLVPKFFIILVMEIMQVLVLLGHIGLFELFIGGAYKTFDVFNNGVLVSVTSEWAGLIGIWHNYLYTGHYWIMFAPLIALFVTIIAFKLILEGLKEVLHEDRFGYVKKTTSKKNDNESKIPTITVDATSFSLVKNRVQR